MHENILKYALEILSEENIKENANRSILMKNQQKAMMDCVKRIENLIKIYISPSNVDKELLSDEEYKEQKSILMKEKAAIQKELNNLDARVNELD